MNVLDLFAGKGGWSAAFRDRGHDVITLDAASRFDVDIHMDVRHFAVRPWDHLPWNPDIVLASPPCEGFTVMNIGKNWHHDGTPKTDTARNALDLVETTLDLLEELHPRFYIIENPRGKLRSLDVLMGYDRRTVTYCQYGEARMKPTDLWGLFPPSLRLRPACSNGDPCHVRAPRGSRTPGSTQGIGGADDRALIPYGLSEAVCLAAERDL